MSAAAARLPAEAALRRLDSGLTVCLLSNRRAPVVTTAVWYRAGTRHEPPRHRGVAHFLEHMMFKGSARYGPGEIDRRTQALGGVNNAFTSHDATAYYFNFAPHCWRQALAVEADRMSGLTLDPREVDSERRVILEEIAMYEADPWDSLDQRVAGARFPNHPYGRPVLGTAADLVRTGGAELAAFHHRFYRPGNAVLVVAGDVGEEALEAVAETFAGVPARRHEDEDTATADGPSPAGGATPAGPGARLEQRKGEVPRLLLACLAPATGAPGHAALRLAGVVLASGRASRLHRRLVDDEQLCTWVSADVSETVDPGVFTVAAELVPDAEPARVEAAVGEELAALGDGCPPSADELERARRVTLADWVFAHERVHQQALSAGFSLALYDDVDHASRQLEATLAVEAEEVAAAASGYLDVTAAVVGWSLPREGDG